MSTEITFFGHTHVCQGAFSQQAPEWQEIRPLFKSAGRSPKSSRIDVPAGTAAPSSIPARSASRARWRLARGLSPSTTPSAERVTFHRIPYDVAAAQQAIRSAHLPERLVPGLSTRQMTAKDLNLER